MLDAIHQPVVGLDFVHGMPSRHFKTVVGPEISNSGGCRALHMGHSVEHSPRAKSNHKSSECKKSTFHTTTQASGKQFPPKPSMSQQCGNWIPQSLPSAEVCSPSQCGAEGVGDVCFGGQILWHRISRDQNPPLIDGCRWLQMAGGCFTFLCEGYRGHSHPPR